MRKKIPKNKPKHVNVSLFEKAMVSVAKSFSKIDKRFDKIDKRFDKIDEKFSQHDEAFTLILKQMKVFTEEAREHRQTMSSLMHTDISQERQVEDLRTRVERLEMRIK